jgi:hypothetical protein
MYFFVIEGAVTIADEHLQRRDAIGSRKPPKSISKLQKTVSC